MAKVKRKCDVCGREYQADTRDLKRGWGLCCCKRCAAIKREQSKPGYNRRRVEKKQYAPGALGQRHERGGGNARGYNGLFEQFCGL